MIIFFVVLFSLTSGGMSFGNYYFAWNGLLRCLKNPKLKNPFLWFGTIKDYSIHLDERKRILEEYLKKNS